MKNWTAHQWTVIGGSGVLAWLVIYFLEGFIFPVEWPRLSIGLLGAGVLGLGVLVYRKQIIQFQDTRQQLADSTAQVDAWWYFYQKVKPRKALPRMRGYAASPDFLNIMVDLVEEIQPRTILECGAGLTTLVNAYLTEAWPNNRIIGLDHQAAYAAITRENLEHHGFTNALVKIHHAPLKSYSLQGQAWQWYTLTAEMALENALIDLLVIDGPPTSIQPMARYPALPILAPYLSEKAVVLIDDAARPDDRAMVARWLQAFPEWEAQFLPTEKGTCVLRRRAS